MDNRPSKLTTEHRFVTILVAHLERAGWAPRFLPSSDPPDFASDDTSLEVTRIYHDGASSPATLGSGIVPPFPRQQYESLIARVADACRRLWLERSGPPGLFVLRFAPQLTMSANEVQRCAAEIVFATHAHLAARRPEELLGTSPLDSAALPNGVVSLSITLTPHRRHASWRAGDSGPCPPLSTASVSRTITRKAVDLPGYAARFKSHWILIATPDDRISGDFDLNGFDPRGVAPEPFHRAFLLVPSTGRVLLLGSTK